MNGSAALRVLVLAPHLPPETGAGATRLASLVEGLRVEGHAVVVLAPTPGYLVPEGAGVPAGDAADGSVRRVAVAPRGEGRLANAAFQWRLRRAFAREARHALEAFPAEVVVASSPPPVAALAALGLRPPGAPRALPVVLDVRDLWPDVLVQAGALRRASLAAAVLRRVERRLLAGACAVTTVTDEKVRILAARAPGRPVELVPNGVDAAWAEGGPAHAGGGVVGPFTVLHAGNVGRAQDVGLLVRAVAMDAQGAAPSGTRPLRAVIVGGGEEAATVRRLAADLGAPAEFHGVEARDRVRERLAACGCALVTLRTAELTDAVPTRLLDAMARGTPVVLAAAGESARIVLDSGGGAVVRPGDAAGLAAALRDLAALDPEARRAIGLRGRAFVLARFRREDAARAFCRVVRQAAAGAGRAGEAP